MFPLSLALVVLAAFIHATWNLLSKRPACSDRRRLKARFASMRHARPCAGHPRPCFI
jgi:hypothetical protein